jgi:hypothetical protein
VNFAGADKLKHVLGRAWPGPYRSMTRETSLALAYRRAPNDIRAFLAIPNTVDGRVVSVGARAFRPMPLSESAKKMLERYAQC